MRSSAKIFGILLSAIIILFTLCSCADKSTGEIVSEETSKYNETNQSNDVTLSLENEVVSAETKILPLVYNNSSASSYTCGEIGTLERRIDDVWYVYPQLPNVAWNALAYEVSPNSYYELPFTLDGYYEQLQPGDYRLIKEIRKMPTNEKSYAILYFTVD